MLGVSVATLAVVSLASVGVNRAETLSASSTKEQDVSPPVKPTVSAVVEMDDPSAREEGATTTPGPALSHLADAWPLSGDGAAPLGDHELTLLHEVGFQHANWTRDHDDAVSLVHKQAKRYEMHEEDDSMHEEDGAMHGARPETAEAAQTTASLLAKRANADDATDTQEIPYYFFNFPISVKFIGVNGDGPVTLVMMDRFTLGTLPYQAVFIYPIVLFVLYTCVWGICCMRSDRTGLSVRLVCEAASCFMCLWADIATKHKVVTATRAWSYIVAMITLLTAWNVAGILTHGTGNEDIVYYVFQALVVVVWVLYAIERMFVRKYYRRTVDPMAGNQFCSDCIASVLCGQITALQEAQFMAEVRSEDSRGVTGASSRKSDKW